MTEIRPFIPKDLSKQKLINEIESEYELLYRELVGKYNALSIRVRALEMKGMDE